MRYRTLGGTGIQVSTYCLGTMMLGAWGNPDHDEGVGIIQAALDAGINFVDTADVYSQGESEVIVGKALAGGRRDDVVLASKVHMPMGEERNQRGNSRRWITREVENSLQRLDTDWIDLYQIHRYDPDTDLDETLGALTDLVRAGKIRYLGHPTFAVSAIVEAQWTARDRGRTVRDRTAAVLDSQPRHRKRRPSHVRTARNGCHLLQPPRRWMAIRPLPQGRRSPGTGFGGQATTGQPF